MSGGNAEEIQKFKDVTGADDKQAQHMLDACNGDMKAAVSLFFESQASPDQKQPQAEGSADVEEVPPPAAFVRKEPKKEKKTDELFVGNGQAVVYGDEQPASEGLLDAARKMGAVPPEEDAKRQEQRFAGAGRRLGNGQGQPTPTPPLDVAPATKPAPTTEVQVKITMWKNGFSVDDGPLRESEAEENKAFIEDIKKGVIPKEVFKKLKEEHGGKGALPEVVFTLEDKQENSYEPPKKQFKAFSCGGRTLGGPTPAPSAQAAAEPPAPAGSVSPIYIDDAKATTTLQLSLTDGTRMQAKFNLEHTIGDIANFVRRTSPNHPPFTLLTTFPRMELTNMALTIKEAGLSRAVVTVKLA
eukprot:TRINITY_DN5320_c1_g1_i1.p1 TRINITY_DN5320_c1_g1~~TRINITY_DN5320_c1_g1_i1.p1  ORF type:complete len:372 (+),score=107.55 TRINITY_DN5320_c1_g1_i1:51-1118(+)